MYSTVKYLMVANSSVFKKRNMFKPFFKFKSPVGAKFIMFEASNFSCLFIYGLAAAIPKKKN